VPGRVLIVDDEPRIGALLSRALEADGWAVECSQDPEKGLALLREQPFDIVVTDLRMPRIDGLEILRRAKAIRPACEVVVMTGHATVATAREALKRGAVDYITKPFSIERELKPVLGGIVESTASDESEEGPVRREEPEERSAEEAVVGRSPRLLQAVEKARKIARARAPVLLRGESGTGKEIFANLIHALSDRCDRPLVKVNCAALPESLLESELFGHVRGAFTGATSDRDGLFKAADGGTIFLDEIGEVSAAFQPKLLRVLQDGEFHRVGEARRAIHADVRVIAATNRDLEEAVRSGAFRQDLYYRLNVVPLDLPPLRERVEDLEDLIVHFARRHAGGRRVRFSERAMDALLRYPWPGNVRELSNAVEYALVLGEAEEVRLGDLPVAIQDFERQREDGLSPDAAPADGDDTLEGIEMRCILQAMVKTGFNRTRAARLLGITRRTLGYRIGKYGLEEHLRSLQEAAEAPAASGPRRMARVRSSWPLGDHGS